MTLTLTLTLTKITGSVTLLTDEGKRVEVGLVV